MANHGATPWTDASCGVDKIMMISELIRLEMLVLALPRNNVALANIYYYYLFHMVVLTNS